MQIYLARNNVQAGPYTLDELNTMLASGEVQLDDLAWHEGMSQWQRLGDLTNNQYVYRMAQSVVQALDDTSSQRSGDQVTSSHDTRGDESQEQKPNASNQRLTVDQLYGRKSAHSPTSDTAGQPTQPTHSSTTDRFSKYRSTQASSQQASGRGAAAHGDELVLASIMSRIGALVINGLLYLLATVPILLALAKMDIDYSKFENIQNYDAALEYSMTLVQSIPTTTLMASQLMVFALFAIQLLLISRRGQSLGKMMLGIRVVDKDSKRLPTWGKLVGMRTLLLFLIYNLLFGLHSLLGLAVIAVHFFMASKSPDNIGWHDRLANTMVVKANEQQLKKAE